MGLAAEVNLGYCLVVEIVVRGGGRGRRPDAAESTISLSTEDVDTPNRPGDNTVSAGAARILTRHPVRTLYGLLAIVSGMVCEL